MGESAEGKGLGRVWDGLGEDRRGDFGEFFGGMVGKLAWEQAYPRLIL